MNIGIWGPGLIRLGKGHNKGEGLGSRPPDFPQGREKFQAIVAVRVSRRKQIPPGSWSAQAPG